MSISRHSLGWGTWIGLAFGATSVPLLLAVVREMQLGESELGKTMIAYAAMGENWSPFFCYRGLKAERLPMEIFKIPFWALFFCCPWSWLPLQVPRY